MVKTVKNKHPYKREVTHHDYLGDSSAIRNNGGAGLLDFRISDKKIKFDKDELPSGEIFENLSENYITKHVAPAGASVLARKHYKICKTTVLKAVVFLFNYSLHI